ncbi:TraR/DksA family transcriptional regulator [Sanguibacter sp. HDW7]|uniref:TraR/DksA family transcriptional regulator n=1 Tax=Sanguibacter sp. HDW7 TaxID=2714931 RepID=UPI00140B0CF8|nr:TraR/DksA family transcriptional regulator [Sanguibacter sp. HDW7]QIK83319.1 TraR/DksA family transcriptional regulator [Sanguibacter sp. HDW7]
MSIQDATPAPTFAERFPRLTKDVKQFQVREGEEPWTTKEVKALALGLIAESERLEIELEAADADLTELLRNSGEGAGDDQADSGSSALEREQELTFVNNTRDLLEQNRRALARIADGSYGTCEVCGGPIGKARLEAFPRAAMCVRCKQLAERR